MKDASAISAVLLALAVLLYVCGDARAATWLGIPGVAFAIFAVWRAK